MSTSQTVSAYNNIVNSLCDTRVNAQEVASLISRASYEEQMAVFKFVDAYLTEYAMQHERQNYVNANMEPCYWAWQMVIKREEGMVH